MCLWQVLHEKYRIYPFKKVKKKRLREKKRHYVDDIHISPRMWMKNGHNTHKDVGECVGE